MTEDVEAYLTEEVETSSAEEVETSSTEKLKLLRTFSADEVCDKLQARWFALRELFLLAASGPNLSFYTLCSAEHKKSKLKVQ